MSNSILRAFVATQNRLAGRGEQGQAAAEYGTVLLIAVALGIAVLGLVTGHAFDGLFKTMISKALSVATKMLG